MAKLNWRKKADEDKANVIADLKKQLSDSDYYYIRKLETNTPIPPDVLQKRADIRKKLKDYGL